MYIPDKGDIVLFSFDPSAGNEVMKRRPAFVISRKLFNEHTGFAVVAPVTSTIRNMRLEVILADDMLIKGSVMIHQMKSLDFVDRQAEFVEKASLSTIKKVTELAKAIIS